MTSKIGWPVRRSYADTDLGDCERGDRRRRAVAPAVNGQGCMLVGDGGQGVGVRESREHDRSGVLALDAREAADGAGDRQVDDGDRA